MTDSDPTTVVIPGDGNVKVGAMTAGDVTALISVFQNMLDRSEQRIIARLDQNSTTGAERWMLHEKEHGAIEVRMSKHEADFETFRDKAIAVYDHYHEQEVAEEARLQPFKLSAQWLWTNWRTILLLLVALVAILGFSGETLDRLAHTFGQ